LGENVADLVAEKLASFDLDTLKSYQPIKVYGYDSAADYRDKYLSDISELALSIGFDSLDDLKKISIVDYYNRVHKKQTEAALYGNVQV
jgi:predicted transcriptional regulator